MTLVKVEVLVRVNDVTGDDGEALAKAANFVRYALATVPPQTLSNGAVIGWLDDQGEPHRYMTDAIATGIVV